MPCKSAHITIPEHIAFADLALARVVEMRETTMDVTPLLAICAANGIAPRMLENEDNLSGLIAAWYHHHRAAGGAPDPVMEQMTAEVAAEDAYGTRAAPGGALQ
jgi:hypothetical protein